MESLEPTVPFLPRPLPFLETSPEIDHVQPAVVAKIFWDKAQISTAALPA